VAAVEIEGAGGNLLRREIIEGVDRRDDVGRIHRGTVAAHREDVGAGIEGCDRSAPSEGIVIDELDRDVVQLEVVRADADRFAPVVDTAAGAEGEVGRGIGLVQSTVGQNRLGGRGADVHVEADRPGRP
jgi:hypothetical protein